MKNVSVELKKLSVLGHTIGFISYLMKTAMQKRGKGILIYIIYTIKVRAPDKKE